MGLAKEKNVRNRARTHAFEVSVYSGHVRLCLLSTWTQNTRHKRWNHSSLVAFVPCSDRRKWKRINSFGWRLQLSFVMCHMATRRLIQRTQSGNLILFLSIIIIIFIRPRIYRRRNEADNACDGAWVSEKTAHHFTKWKRKSHKSPLRRTQKRSHDAFYTSPPSMSVSLSLLSPSGCVCTDTRTKFNCSSLSTCMCAVRATVDSTHSYHLSRVANDRLASIRYA